MTGFEDPIFLFGSSKSVTNDGQDVNVVADKLVEFINRAKKSVHIAIYDFRLSDGPGQKVLGALKAKADAGVEVKVAYDHRNVPKKFELGDDPAPHGTDDFLSNRLADANVKTQAVGWTDINGQPIAGSKLMHNKYVVIDGGSPDAATWTGSTNFTDDAWTKQDNNILICNSPALSAYYETDFNELWTSGTIVGTGVNDFGTVDQPGLDVDVAFSPGEGKRIDAEIAQLIREAQSSVHIASMVITSSAVLSALTDVIAAGKVKVTGIFDGPQMDQALAQMNDPVKKEAIAVLQKKLVAKDSHPYTEDGVHDFMHDKLVVVDDTLITGSHNFSLSAQSNAENALLIRDGELAAKYRDYVEKLVKRYT